MKRMEFCFLGGGCDILVKWSSKLVFPIIKINGKYSSVNGICNESLCISSFRRSFHREIVLPNTVTNPPAYDFNHI